MDPINYNQDVATPFQSVLQGFQAGAGMDQIAQQQQLQQQQIQQQQQMRVDMAALASKQNPTGQDYSALMTKYPAMADHFKKSWDVLNSQQQQNKLGQATQVQAALLQNQPEIASQLLLDQAKAARNSGNEQDAAGAETMAKLIGINPQAAKTSVALWLSSAMGPEKYATTFGTLGDQQRSAEQAPADLLKKKSDAAKAAAEAGAAPEKVVLDNQKAAEDIKTAQNQRRIAELDVQIKQANSETERGKLQLERDKLVFEQNQKLQAVTSDNQTHMDTISQSLSTVGELMKHPGLNSGTGMGSTVASFFNGTDAKDFRLQVETLKSQQFLTAAKELKGMGALSDAEGARIEKAVASLDTNMSTKQFKNNLGVIQNTLQKAQSKLVASGKLPTAGGAFIMTHPVYGTVKDGDINRLLTQFPGSTRQQVIDYLKSTGGK